MFYFWLGLMSIATIVLVVSTVVVVWRKINKKTETERPKPSILIDGWRLSITVNSGRQISLYDHPELKELWKIYGWYLTKDSEKYNIHSKQGYEILHRCNVVEMKLSKIKLPKEDWVTKENNDETETD